MKQLLLLTLSLATTYFSVAQFSITSLNTPFTEDFNSYDGSGIVFSPAIGQLSSEAWRVTGLSDDPNAYFGLDYNSNDFIRGTSAGNVTAGGLYAFDNGSSILLGVQPTESDFTDGAITLKIQNNTGSAIGSFEVNYDIWINNNADRSSTFNFFHGADTLNLSQDVSMNYQTDTLGDGLGWQMVSRSATISGLNLADGDVYYIQWYSEDNGGGGSRDEFGIDDLSITALAPPPCVNPNLLAQNDTVSCQFFVLPTISGTNLTGNQSYYTGSNGSGTNYDAGDTIFANQTLYIYDADGLCTDEDTFDISIVTGASFTMQDTLTACDSLTLGAIVGNDLNGTEHYYIEINGQGTELDSGDVIHTSQTIYLYSELNTPVFCPSNDSIEIVISQTPSFTMESDYESCDSIQLPVISGNHLSGNEAYYTNVNGGGQMYNAGEYLNANTLLYLFDVSPTNPNCSATQSVVLIVSPSIDAGADFDTTVLGFHQLDLTDFIDDPNGDGEFYETTNPPSGQFNDIDYIFNTGGLNGTFTFEYIVDGCLQDTAILTIEVIDTSLSINSANLQSEETVLIYPNPTESFIYIDGIEINSFEIYDLTGKLILFDYRNQMIQKIAVSELKKGAYFIRLKSKGSIVTKQFFKK